VVRRIDMWACRRVGVSANAAGVHSTTVRAVKRECKTGVLARFQNSGVRIQNLRVHGLVIEKIRNPQSEIPKPRSSAASA
jgi:hypothetical protein